MTESIEAPVLLPPEDPTAAPPGEATDATLFAEPIADPVVDAVTPATPPDTTTETAPVPIDAGIPIVADPDDEALGDDDGNDLDDTAEPAADSDDTPNAVPPPPVPAPTWELDSWKPLYIFAGGLALQSVFTRHQPFDPDTPASKMVDDAVVPKVTETVKGSTEFADLTNWKTKAAEVQAELARLVRLKERAELDKADAMAGNQNGIVLATRLEKILAKAAEAEKKHATLAAGVKPIEDKLCEARAALDARIKGVTAETILNVEQTFNEREEAAEVKLCDLAGPLLEQLMVAQAAIGKLVNASGLAKKAAAQLSIDK
jgi:hypothetical protein